MREREKTEKFRGKRGVVVVKKGRKSEKEKAIKKRNREKQD